MFITLKASNQNGDTSMEQVASRNAEPNANGHRASSSRWRAPCVACQAKGLRCTGRSRDCDRCMSRDQICIYPAFRVGPSRKNRRVALGSQAAPRDGGVGGQGETRSDGADASTATLESGGDDDHGNKDGPVGGDVLASTAVAADVQGDFGQDLMNFATFSADHGIQQHDSQYQHVEAVGVSDDFFPQPAQQSQPNMSTNLAIPSSHHIPTSGGDFNMLTLQSFGFDTAATALAGPSPGSTSASVSVSASSSQSCSCIENTVRVVQQLENDDFRLTALPMDEVIQLKKWLVGECRTAIRCQNCNMLPTARTMVVIICDRLSEMFECIYRRIQRVNQHISEQTTMVVLPSGGFYAALTPDSSDEGASPLHHQQQEQQERQAQQEQYKPSLKLYCSITEEESNNTLCNPMLFQASMQDTYTYEEQVHMISALLHLQIKNMIGLLSQVEGAAQITGSLAQMARVKSFQVRVAKASDNIERALANSLRLFAAAPV